MGGDEFVIVLPTSPDRETVENIAIKIQEQIARPVVIAGRELVVTSSIGITTYPQDGRDVATLLKNADTAMYQAKSKGRNNHQWFTPGMLLDTEERLELENALRRAIERNELTLHYQPLVATGSGQVLGMEALLRWQHPQRGAVAPESFIPIAEESGLISSIGEWALHTACRDARQIQARLGKPLYVSVNLSPRQFHQVNLQKMVESALAASGLEARFLTLEITETVLVSNPEEASEILEKIRALNVAIAIDDFGTGYSSLSYITRYPIDKIKIDRSFIHNLGADAYNTAIINAIIAMAHSLDIRVIAEGVETREQLAYLREHGCDEVQGFYFGKGRPVAEFESHLHPAAVDPQ
jgi:EAL domain-containing protein (putative c-di-GMP-specific phosphodiesterase class I)